MEETGVPWEIHRPVASHWQTWSHNAVSSTPQHERDIKRVWRYQRGNQNPHIDEEQTTQWPKEKVQMDEQRPTKYTLKTKDRETRVPLKPGVNSGVPEELAVPAPLVAPVWLI